MSHPCWSQSLSPGRVGAIAAVLAGLVALSGCAGGGSITNTYDLALPADVATLSGATPAQILIREPRALKALDAERIVIRPEPTEITYLGDAQFSDRLPVVVQARLIEAFERSDGARAVGAPGDGLLIDYTISTELRRFEILAYGSDVAEIEISAKLINERNGRVVASEVFRSTSPTSANSPDRVAGALNAAFGTVVKDLVSWTYSKI